jgi:hypothetical protein
MQAKSELLISARAKKMYKYFCEKGIPSTICRGTTTNEIDFFYGAAPFWSSYCVGWVKEIKDKYPVCMYCKLAEPPENIYPKDKESFSAPDAEKEKAFKPKNKLIKKNKK